MSELNRLIDWEKVQQCPRSYTLALTDTLNVINGKWKLPIIASLMRDVNRFKDLLERVEKITPRMLSKELKSWKLTALLNEKSITVLRFSLNIS